MYTIVPWFVLVIIIIVVVSIVVVVIVVVNDNNDALLKINYFIIPCNYSIFPQPQSFKSQYSTV